MSETLSRADVPYPVDTLQEPYAFADDTLFPNETLVRVIRSADAEKSIATMPHRAERMEKIAKIAVFEYWSRKNRDGTA